MLAARFADYFLQKEGRFPETLPTDNTQKSFVILAENGEILYRDDNAGLFPEEGKKLLARPESERALETGSGESEAYTAAFFGKIYSYAHRLSDGSLLIVSSDTLDIFSLMNELVAVLVFMCVLIFALTAIIAKRLTENIVAPIEKTSLTEIDEQLSPYDELRPFISKISYQSKEIKRQMERVKRQKLRLQAVSDSMNEGLIVLDRDGDILSVNHSAMQAFGVTDPDKVKNTNILELAGHEPNFSANIALAYGNKRGSFYHTLPGHTYEIFYSPVSDGSDVMGVVILMFDMTDKLRNEQIRTEFTANVSHELKTPLTSIHGYAQLMTNGLAKPEDMLTFAGKIEKESGRLITLVEDIIKLSNLDEGIKPEKCRFAIRPLITEIFDTLSLAAGRKNVSFSLSGGDFEIEASKSQMHELFYNILDNAVKYNKDGGSVTVTVGKNEVTIADTGIGIPEDCRERIFERFFRVDKSHSKTVNGTGLGLSIVKHIAMNNHLNVHVDSTLGKGTVFTVEF